MLTNLKTRLKAWAAPAMLALSVVMALATTVLSPPVARTAALVGAGYLTADSAHAALTLSTASRDAMANAVLGRLAGGTIKIYNGTKPSALGTPAGTLCATLTLGSPAGTVSSGVITIGSVTQTNSSHVNCTPTFIRYSGSGGTVEADIDIGSGAGNVQFTGTVVTGQNVTVTGLTLTMPNA